jgi:hypothetical protein
MTYREIRLHSARPLRVAVAFLALSVMLSGCGSLGAVFGNKKSPPDEFAIVTKAPLVIPPDYSLRPPEPGSTRPQELEPAAAAQRSVFGIREPEIEVEEGKSPGEAALLARAGATYADPEIRRLVNSETSALEKKSDSFTNQLLFWQGDEAGGAMIDPESEAERIRESTARGEPAGQANGQVVPPMETAPPAEPDANKNEDDDDEGFFERLF